MPKKVSKKVAKFIADLEKQLKSKLGDTYPQLQEFVTDVGKFLHMQPLEVGDRVKIWTTRGSILSGNVTEIFEKHINLLDEENNSLIKVRYADVYSIAKVERDEVATTSADIAPVPMRLIRDKKTGKTWIGKVEGPYPNFGTKKKRRKIRYANQI